MAFIQTYPTVLTSTLFRGGGGQYQALKRKKYIFSHICPHNLFPAVSPHYFGHNPSLGMITGTHTSVKDVILGCTLVVLNRWYYRLQKWNKTLISMDTQLSAKFQKKVMTQSKRLTTNVDFSPKRGPFWGPFYHLRQNMIFPNKSEYVTF